MGARLLPLKNRAEFVALRSGMRRATKGFVLQGLARADTPRLEPTAIRFGLTATKELGNAVTRNRARRRLRALARACLTEKGQSGWDYVLIARDGALTLPFATLKADLETALEMLQMSPRGGGGRRDRPKSHLGSRRE